MERPRVVHPFGMAYMGVSESDPVATSVSAVSEVWQATTKFKTEKEVRHDVMSHVKAYGLQCDKAKGIIHLGATSAYVGDNTDVIQMNEALKLIRVKLVNLINNLKEFSLK